jgi:hypothetical protein
MKVVGYYEVESIKLEKAETGIAVGPEASVSHRLP